MRSCGACWALMIILTVVYGRAGFAGETPRAIKVGVREFVVSRFDALPYVEDEFSRRFRFDRHDNPKLKALRSRYALDEVVIAGRDEFERQVLLLDWVHNRIGK